MVEIKGVLCTRSFRATRADEIGQNSGVPFFLSKPLYTVFLLSFLYFNCGAALQPKFTRVPYPLRVAAPDSLLITSLGLFLTARLCILPSTERSCQRQTNE